MSGNLWEYSGNETGMKGFSINLGCELEAMFKEQERDVRVNLNALDRNTGYMLTLISEDRFMWELMITEKKYGSPEKGLIINRFLGITHAPPPRFKGSSLTKHLRNVADAYDTFQSFIEQKFGKPISEHHGRAIYTAFPKKEQEVLLKA